jgi:hypothetical protein
MFIGSSAWNRPLRPVKRLPLGVGDGNDPKAAAFLQIHDRVGKAPHKHATMSRPVTGPTVGERDDQLEGPLNLGHERVMHRRASFTVPPRGINVLIGGIGMESQSSSAHGLAGRSAA